MSVWNHLPLELHGAVWDARFPVWPGDVVMWWWIDANGTHRRHVGSSRYWSERNPMADVMLRNLLWWTLTKRDEQLRAGLFVPPWKITPDYWESVGILDAESKVPWPWPRSKEAAAT